MKPGYTTLLLALLLYFFGGTVFDGTETSSQEFDAGTTESQNRFTIASFNLGSVDLTDLETIRATADILSRFEIVALQCIRSDNAASVMDSLVEELNRYGHHFEYLLGPIVKDGLNRYAFVHRADIMRPVEWHSYDDSKENNFGSEAFFARFETYDAAFDFTLINYYAEPESRPQEIDLLPLVIEDVKLRFPGETDIIILCSAKTDYDTLSVSDPFKSLEQKDYILLLDAETNQGKKNIDDPIDSQIIVVAASEEMFWEDAGLLAIDSESINEQDTDAVLLSRQPGFSSIVIVNNVPEDAEDVNNGKSSKAFCFFGTTSN